MMFKVSGKLDGRPVEVTWDAGELTGDDMATARVRALAERYKNIPLAWGPQLPSYGDHLKHAGASLSLILKVLTAVTITGDSPGSKAPKGQID